MLNDDEKTKLIISSLEDTVKVHMNWVQRKEVAAWAAILFYAAILYTTKEITLISLCSSNYSSTLIIFYSIVTILILYLFLRFVHSQYSTIHYWSEYFTITKEKIFKIIQDGGLNSDDLKGLSKNEDIYAILINKVKEETEKTYKRSFSIRNMYALFVREPFLYIFKKKDTRKLNNTHRQELITYGLIFVMYFLYLLNFLTS